MEIKAGDIFEDAFGTLIQVVEPAMWTDPRSGEALPGWRTVSVYGKTWNPDLHFAADRRDPYWATGRPLVEIGGTGIYPESALRAYGRIDDVEKIRESADSIARMLTTTLSLLAEDIKKPLPEPFHSCAAAWREVRESLGAVHRAIGDASLLLEKIHRTDMNDPQYSQAAVEARIDEILAKPASEISDRDLSFAFGRTRREDVRSRVTEIIRPRKERKVDIVLAKDDADIDEVDISVLAQSERPEAKERLTRMLAQAGVDLEGDDQ